MRKKTSEEFRKEFYSLTNNDYLLLSEYETAIKKIKVKHLECGCEYEVTPNKFLEGRRCPNCRWKRTAISESIKFEDAKEKISKCTNGEYELLDFKSAKDYVTICCTKCGNKKIIKYNNIFRKISHCKCNDNNYLNQVRKNKEQELKECCYQNGYELLSPYEKSDKKVLIKHLICGTEWYDTPINFKRGYRCPHCSMSKGEIKIENFLKEHKICYETQKKFEGCKCTFYLRFDFYLPEYNLCIEYQGKQHYVSVKRFGGEDSFNKSQERDEIKRIYCSNNNIELLEIKYIDFDNIDSILSKILEKGGKLNIEI